jgi:ABC-2 type transport system permease protein
VSTAAHRPGAVFGAFVYLQATSLYNTLRQRLLRLRQPKYLVGAVVGAAYLYFFLFHRMLRVGNAVGPKFALSADLLADVSALTALALAVYVIAEWVVSDSRAQLAFNEAEIDFLFPAPLTRLSLIHFGLLRSQLAIFFSSFLLGLLARRGGGLSGHALQFTTGLWLLFSMVKLHALGAAFTRERLLGLGVRPWLRRVVAAFAAIALLLVCAWWMRDVLHAPPVEALSDFSLLRRWFEGIVGVAPLSWLLVPFRWAVAPIFAPDANTFLHALWPALALLALHYLWVVRAQVSFEDAAIVQARRRAERHAAMRQGRFGQRTPGKPRGEAFRLHGQGEPWLAFLWKGLIRMGAFYRLRTWLVACVAAVVACQWLAADPVRRHVLVVIGVAVPAMGAWLLFLGPIMMQRGLRSTFERMDVLKALPLRGWQIAFGELATPAAVMCFAGWWLLLVGVQAMNVAHTPITNGQVVAAAIGIAVVAPPLFGLMLSVPFAGMLYFPAWIVAPGSSGRGIEVMGQRMVFMLGYLCTVLVAAIPAALLGGIGLLVGRWLGGWPAGILLASCCACAVFAIELALWLRLLGRRIDRFDLSQELR